MDLNALGEKPSMFTRIAIGKALGLIVGLLGFVLIPMFVPDVSTMFRWAILLWYTTFGAIVGVFGVFTYHPVLQLPMPWWFRAPVIGAWLNFVLTLFIYDELKMFMTSMFGENGMLASPFWFAFEGAVVGLVFGYLCTRFGGEGAATVRDQDTL